MPNPSCNFLNNSEQGKITLVNDRQGIKMKNGEKLYKKNEFWECLHRNRWEESHLKFRCKHPYRNSSQRSQAGYRKYPAIWLYSLCNLRSEFEE